MSNKPSYSNPVHQKLALPVQKEVPLRFLDFLKHRNKHTNTRAINFLYFSRLINLSNW